MGATDLSRGWWEPHRVWYGHRSQAQVVLLLYRTTRLATGLFWIPVFAGRANGALNHGP